MQDDRALTTTDAVGDRWILPAFASLDAIPRLVRNNGRVGLIAISGGHYAGASGVAMFKRKSRFLRDRMQLFSPEQPLDALVASLNEFQPAILGGYATVLVELAREQREGRLNITPAILTPTAEAISEAEKREVQWNFECIVKELYGATEFYAIAGECSRGNLHANTDWVVLEPVDQDYQPVLPGEPSDTVLVTNLANRIQPIVRYDLGDSVTLYEEPCPCGSPFPVIEVEGRQGDILRFETGDGETTPIFPLTISSVIEAVPSVRRAQIVRAAPATLRVRLDVTATVEESKVWEQVERDLLKFLQQRGITDVSVERADTASERDPTSGKFRHVWSNLA